MKRAYLKMSMLSDQLRTQRKIIQKQMTWTICQTIDGDQTNFPTFHLKCDIFSCTKANYKWKIKMSLHKADRESIFLEELKYDIPPSSNTSAQNFALFKLH